MERKKRILLIDLSSIMHSVKHSGLKNAKIKSTFIIFNTLLKLQYFRKKTIPDVFVFALDSKSENSLRKKIFSGYKGTRKTKRSPEQIALDKIAYPQFFELENSILKIIGFSNIFRKEGFEADDIIASICKTYKNSEIIIVSTDHDLYQLLRPTVCLLNPMNSKYYTFTNFEQEYGLHPKMWKRVKAYCGCLSDEVPGIPGVAEKTILKFLKNELPSHYKTYQSIVSEEGKKIVNRNKELVILPFKGTPSYFIKEDRITKSGIKEIAIRYNFTSMLSDLDNWYANLKGFKADNGKN